MEEFIFRTTNHLEMNVVDIQDDILIRKDGSVYVTHTKLKRIIDLQRKYGTGRVSYIPHPILILDSDIKYERENTCLIITPGLNHELEQFMHSHEDNWENISVVHENQLNETNMIPLFRSVNFILLHDLKNSKIFYFVLGSATPFYAVNCKLDSVENVLKGARLSRLIYDIDNSEPGDLENGFELVLERREFYAECLRKRLNNFKRLFSALTQTKGFRDINYSNLNYLPNLSRKDIPPLSISPGDYDGNAQKLIASDFSRYQVRGGVHFELTVFDAFLELGTVYLHPWIGLIETLDVKDYEYLVNCKEFRISSSMCLGLIVLCDKSEELLLAALNGAGIKLIVVYLPLPIIRSENIFNLEEWKIDPVIRQGLDHLYLNKDGIDRLEKIEPKALVVTTEPKTLIIGSIYSHLSQCRPLILERDEMSEFLLGKDYPLFTSNLRPYQLREIVTVKSVTEAHEYLKKIPLRSTLEFLLRLHNTKIGNIIGQISRISSEESNLSPMASSSSASP